MNLAFSGSPDRLQPQDSKEQFPIKKHESLNDWALFLSPTDPREFWQRTEDRNRDTAWLYGKFGLPEYEAIAGLVLHKA